MPLRSKFAVLMGSLLAVASVAVTMAFANSEPFDSLKQSVADCSKRIITNGKDAGAYRQRGQAYFRLAIRQEDEILKSGQAYGGAYSYLYEFAIRDFSSALKIDKHDVDALMGRGQAYLALGPFAEQNDLQASAYDLAIEDFKAALGRRPLSAYINCQLGSVYQYVSENKAALKEYDRALALQHGFTMALIGRAEIHEQMGLWGLVIDDAEQAIQQEPNLAQAHALKANALLEDGKAPEAISEYSTALSLEPSNRQWHYARSRAYQEFGDIALAQRDLAVARAGLLK